MFKRTKVLVLTLLVTFLSVSPLTVNATSKTENAFDLIDMIINAEVDYGLSGAQLVVMHKGEVVKQSAYGYTNSYENVVRDGKDVLDEATVIARVDRNKVTNDTLFDLASNTKMYAGNYAIQYLVSQGELKLDTKLVELFPEFKYNGIGVDAQDRMTVGHLLRHDSGFIASPKYHDNNFDGNLGNKDKGINWLYSQDPKEMLEKLLLTPIEYDLDEKVRYSDVDFMLIGKIVEKITDQPFDEFLKEKIYGPLGLNSITFNPLLNGFSKNDTSSSELHGNTRDGRVHFNNERKNVITGEVHDEKAFYSFGGVAGHAGLFGNATDVASLAQLMLDGGKKGEIEIFTQDTIDKVMTPSTLNDTYAYGWRRMGESKGYDWAFSEFASPRTVGHTGWTGTITQIDPDQELVIALFTNARNSPIMGPDKNDFFTKSFKTNGYGTITTLVYEALDLGSGISNSDFVIKKIEEISALDTASQRNSNRALYTVLKELALSDDVARDYILEHLDTEVINDSLDTDVTHLDAKFITEVKKEKLATSINQAKDRNVEDRDLDFAKLILNDKTATQKVVDELVKKVDALEGKELVDTSKLELLLTKISELDEKLYSEETYSSLMNQVKEVKEFLLKSEITQSEVDEHFEQLAKVYHELKYKDLVSEDDIKKPGELTEGSKPVVPNTGLKQEAPLFLGVIISGLGLLTLLRRKHKEI